MRYGYGLLWVVGENFVICVSNPNETCEEEEKKCQERGAQL